MSGFFYQPAQPLDPESEKWLPPGFKEKMVTHAVKENIDRKRFSIDEVQYFNDTPLFSWVELNINEICNRKCPFCPRSGSYPNQNIHMDIGIAESIAFQLDSLRFGGTVNISGTGEPMLSKGLKEIVSKFGSRKISIEIVTNGDRLRPSNITDLYEAGLSQLVVSMYDGPHQIEKFHKLFKEAGIDSSLYTLRDRWYNEDEDYGLIYTNRAGSLDQDLKNSLSQPCYYPAYALYIDWNGDVLLCCQDMYNRTLKFSNVTEKSIIDIWMDPELSQFRQDLHKGERKNSPCSNCNANGMVFGKNHSAAWAERG